MSKASLVDDPFVQFMHALTTSKVGPWGTLLLAHGVIELFVNTLVDAPNVSRDPYWRNRRGPTSPQRRVARASGKASVDAPVSYSTARTVRFTSSRTESYRYATDP